MGIFGPTKEKVQAPVTPSEADNLSDQIGELTEQLVKVEAELKARKEELDLNEENNRLKDLIEEKKRELARMQEDHARAERETEHKLGLHRKQVEAEREQAVKEAELRVREENIEALKERQNDEVQMIKDSMERELESSRKLMEQILGRLPNFDVVRQEHHYTGNVPAAAIESGDDAPAK